MYGQLEDSSLLIYFFVAPFVHYPKEIFIELLPSAVCGQYILQTVWPVFISQTVVSHSIHISWPLIPGLCIMNVLSDITQIGVVDAAR